MALNCPINITYNTSPQQKMRAKDAVRRYKFGSPKMRDVLREKCRARVKEARRTSFDNARNVGNEALIKQILREEVAELEEDLKLQELIYQEMMEEANEWFVEEYEKQETYLMDIVTEESGIFCPVCQRYCLQPAANEFTCDCGISFYYGNTLEVFYKHIQSILQDHEKNCNHGLVFFTEPACNNLKKLCTLCENCDYFFSF